LQTESQRFSIYSSSFVTKFVTHLWKFKY
jgi:hypothetical protein